MEENCIRQGIAEQIAKNSALKKYETFGKQADVMNRLYYLATTHDIGTSTGFVSAETQLQAIQLWSHLMRIERIDAEEAAEEARERAEEAEVVARTNAAWCNGCGEYDCECEATEDRAAKPEMVLRKLHGGPLDGVRINMPKDETEVVCLAGPQDERKLYRLIKRTDGSEVMVYQPENMKVTEEYVNSVLTKREIVIDKEAE